MAVGQMLTVLLALLLNRADSAADSTDGYIVSTANGDLLGVKYVKNQEDFVKFLGVPYAQPPTGTMRFKPPGPPSKWSGTRNATMIGSECPQTTDPLYTLVFGIPKDEDCLFLNIWAPVPNVTSTAALPVMVWIHGGAYYIGGGSQYDGSELAATGVIVVTFNYRLAALGFLSTETDVMPGNYGMLDQVQALRWVQNNIASFGGDPNQVTIFGESAGSSSVSFHILSPLSQGLFQRAIMESGVSLCRWAMAHPATHVSPRHLANLVIERVGCANVDQAEVLTCMQNVEAFFLHNTTQAIFDTLQNGLLLGPRVENVYGFLPDLPVRLLATGQFHQVDSIRGFNVEESGNRVEDPKDEGLSFNSFKQILSEQFFQLYAFTDAEQLMQEMVDLYVGNSTDPFFLREKAVEILSDLDFKGATMNELNLVSKSAPDKKQYLYQFNYRPSFSIQSPWLKAVHADEVPFVFGVHNPVFSIFMITPTDDDSRISNQMLTMWSNFAKTGDPNSPDVVSPTTWTPYTENDPQYLNFDVTTESLRYNRTQVTDLYKEIIQKLDTSLDINVVVG